MKAHLDKLSPASCALMAVPLILIGYPVVTVVVPIVVRAVVPEVVRTVFSLI